MIRVLTTLLFSTFLFCACATIVGEKTQLISIGTNPQEAKVSITDEKGNEVFKGKTPTTVILEKADGTYFGGKDYALKVERDGYEPHIVTIRSEPNGWYIAGNLVFGGLIGWLIVDPLTGAMWTLSPSTIQINLETRSEKTSNSNVQELRVALLGEVPENLRGHLKTVRFTPPDKVQEKLLQ